jgi:hypothetical protein
MTRSGVLAVAIDYWEAVLVSASAATAIGALRCLNQEKAAEKVMAFCHLFNRCKETGVAMFSAVQEGGESWTRRGWRLAGCWLRTV